MKKNILKVTLALVAIPLLLASCLGGDSGYKFENVQGISYIKSSTNPITNKIAFMKNTGAFSSPEVKRLDVGSFYELSFDWNSTDNGYLDDENYYNQVMNATNVRFKNTFGDPIPETYNGYREDIAPTNDDKQIHPYSIGLDFYSPYLENNPNAIDNKFVFTYSCRIDKSEIQNGKDYPAQVELIAYYDPENQKVSPKGSDAWNASENLPDDQARITLVMKRTSPVNSPTNPEYTKTDGKVVIDLSQLKYRLKDRGGIKPDEYNARWATIQFYYQALPSNNTGELQEKTIGTFSGNSGEGQIQMLLSVEE